MNPQGAQIIFSKRRQQKQVAKILTLLLTLLLCTINIVESNTNLVDNSRSKDQQVLLWKANHGDDDNNFIITNSIDDISTRLRQQKNLRQLDAETNTENTEGEEEVVLNFDGENNTNNTNANDAAHDVNKDIKDEKENTAGNHDPKGDVQENVNGNPGTTKDDANDSGGKPNDANDDANDKDDDSCSNALKCEDCLAVAHTMEGEEKVCMWDNDASSCQKAESATAQNLDDMCTKEDESSKPTEDGDGEGGNTVLFVIIGCLIVGGGLFAKKKFSSSSSGPGGGGFGGGGFGGGGSSAQRSTKYHTVSGSDEDEGEDDWGWDDNGASGSGDVEMANREETSISSWSSKDDSSVKRRTTSESPVGGTKSQSVAIGSTISSSTKSMKLSAGSSIGGMSLAAPPSIPVAPKTSPAGFHLPTGTTSPPIVGASPPVRSSSGGAALPSTSAPTSVAPTLPAPLPQKITSLGKSKKSQKTDIAPTEKPEDDIFASMGLSAKPTFSTSAVPKTNSQISSSRWGQAVATTPAVTKTTSATAAAAAATVTSTSLLSPSKSMDEMSGDADWGDDADLDDLLDD